MTENNLTRIELKIPTEWKQPFEEKTRQKGYVTISEALRSYIRDLITE
jgi:metal-responsive CopG/Arc/MetJ family transcriptional regulator